MDNVYDLLVELKNLGARLYYVNDKIKLDVEPGVLTSEISDKIKFYRKEILSLLQESNNKSDFVKIEKLPSQESYALSDGQRRLWVLSQFEGSSAAYNIPGSIYLDSKVNVEAVKKSLWAVLERHEILRTVYKQDDSGELRQWILSVEDSGFNIDYQDFRGEQNKIELVESYLGKISGEEFDLEKGSFKVSLIRLEEEDYVLYYKLHHINTDGWSMGVLMRDLRRFYDAYQAGQVPDIAPLKFQYKDYAAWQLEMLEDEAGHSHRKFWLDSLKGELSRLDLPGYKPRPKVLTHSGEAYNGSFIGAQAITRLKKYAEKNGGSLFMGLIAAWNVLMYRYTSQKDIIIGTPLNGREHADTIDQIGFYVNTLAIRNKLSPEENFGSVFKKVKQNMLDAYAHQAYPFNRLVQELNLPKDVSRNTLFDIMLVFNGADKKNDSSSGEAPSSQMIQVAHLTTKFDLEIGFKEIDAYIQVWGVFNPDVYEQAMVEGLIRHYKQLLTALLESPEEKISQIDYLSEQEKHELLFAFNDTAVAYSKDKTVVDLFEEQAAKTPDNVALVFAEKELTYRELNERSNQLAHYLKENYTIQPDDLIGIQLDRSEWMIISMLGVLKAGGAYVPIDPEYPSSRKEYIVKDSSIALLITGAGFIYDIDYYGGAIFAIDVEFDPDNYSAEALPKTFTPGHLAYVIYTSGSTGNPKGV
ncbi:non-ribosomal peptide synthetase, partial [Niastella populi]|uniref:non-ribosomal peptide synthetase n=1 Tax=Niastella populi TaxID=550983 RepID=UPI0013FDB1ED